MMADTMIISERLDVSFGAAMAERAFRSFIAERGFNVVNVNYAYSAESRSFDYNTVIWTGDSGNLRRLAESLRAEETVREFKLAAIGD